MTAKDRGTAALLGKAAKVWKREVEAFGGELSLAKSIAIAGSSGLRHRLAKELAELGIKTAMVTRDLGVDMTAGA